MGFLDKLKDTAATAVKGAVQAAAHPYGIVTQGEYAGCKLCSNHDYTDLVFILVAAEKGKVNIAEGVTTFEYLREAEKIASNVRYVIRLYYTDGKTSDVVLSADENMGNALPPAQHMEAMYREMAKLLRGLMTGVSEPVNDDTKAWVNGIMSFAGLPQF